MLYRDHGGVLIVRGNPLQNFKARPAKSLTMPIVLLVKQVVLLSLSSRR